MSRRTDADWNVELEDLGEASASPGGAGKPWAARAPGSVAFRDEGSVTPSRDDTILAALAQPRSIVAEELRLLAVRLQDVRRERGLCCLAVTSTMPGEGKSTVALGLAGALAREPGRRILLIEADHRRPSLAATLGLPPAAGLAEWLNGGLDSVPLRLVGSGGFFLLVAGEAELERPELLGSARMDALLRAARRLFDFVLLDAVPVLPIADAVLLQDLVDGFLLVVRSRSTRRGAVHDALARLRPQGVVGLVLNDHDEPHGSYAARAYRDYGLGYGPPASGGKGERHER